MEVTQSRALEYNSLREKLIIPEYGRNVQKLVNNGIEIEDDTKRQEYFETLVELIYSMNPQSKNVHEYRERLWRHMFVISDFRLNVKTPSGVIPTREENRFRPEKIEYPSFRNRHKHYGNNVKKMIDKAADMELGQKRDEFIQLIGSFMKTAYKNWNREHYVNDKVIFSDIEAISKGKVIPNPEMTLDLLFTSFQNKSSGKYSNKSKSRHSGSNRKRVKRKMGGGSKNRRR